MTSRQIFKGRDHAAREVEHLLQSIFAAELIDPSPVLWLVSPWVTDVHVLDNRSGVFAGLEPAWGNRSVRLVEVLVALMQRRCGVVVATRADDHNDRFVQRLRDSAGANGVLDRLLIRIDENGRLHEKGLLGRDFYLSGSMNFTYNGIRINDEAVKYDLTEEAVAQARLHFRQCYGIPAG